MAGLSLAVTMLAGCGGSDPASSPTPTPTTPGRSTASPSAPSGTTSTRPRATDWPTYHGTLDRSGLSTSMPTVSGKPKLVQSIKLDGEVYASPIVVRGITVVATENDTVYAFDRSYRQLWKRRLGSPSPASERQCGNIDPLGITGTPTYDAGTGQVYLVAEHRGSGRHVLYALDPTSGRVTWSRSVDQPGVTARDMQQRGAMAVASGRVWVTYGALAGDCGNYKGRVIGVPLDGRGPAVSYTAPTARGGGIWDPGGPTLDPAGNLLVVSGNGAAFPGDAYDHTNSVLELDGAAKVVDSFAPTDWAAHNEGDVDLGSQGVALVGGRWGVLGDKSGAVYVLRIGDLGGIGGQVDVQDMCQSYGGAAVERNVVYLPCADGVRAVRVDHAGRLHALWHAAGSVTGSPVIGGGRVWALDTDAGVLHALDPDSGRSVADLNVGVTSRFATPALHGADVIVPTLTGIAVVRTS
jgi:outer membrane protein assembly factor BamB